MRWTGQWSVVSGQWSVVSGQWSVVSGQWPVCDKLKLNKDTPNDRVKTSGLYKLL